MVAHQEIQMDFETLWSFEGLRSCEIYTYFIQKSLYHNGYCLCAVTGRSGKGTQTFLFSRFCSLSLASLILVASSFNKTETAEHMIRNLYM